MAVDPEGRINLRYVVDQASVKTAAQSAETVTDAYTRSAEQIAADNERLSAVVAKTREKLNAQLVKSTELTARAQQEILGSATTEAQVRNEAYNASAQKLMDEETRGVKANVKEQLKLRKDLADEEAKDLKLRERQLQDAIKNEIALRKDFAKWQKQLQKELVENAKSTAAAEKQAIQEQIAELSIPFDDIAGGGGGEPTTKRKFSGRGFGALGRLTGRLGLPSAVEEGLFIAGEGVTSSRGLSTLPFVGGAAKGGADLATKGFDALAKTLGVTGAVVPPFVTSLASLAAVLVPLAAAVALIAAGVQRFQTTIAPAKRELDIASEALTAYFTAIREGTSKSIRKQIEDLREQQIYADAELKIRKDARDNAFTSEQSGGGDFLARLKFGIGDLSGAFKSSDERAKELEDQSIKTAGAIAGMTTAEQSAAVAANDARQARIDQTNQRQSDDQRQLQQDIALAQIGKLTTSESVQAELDRNKALTDNLTIERSSADALHQVYGESAKTVDLYDEYTGKLTALDDELANTVERTAALTAQLTALREAEALRENLTRELTTRGQYRENDKTNTVQAALARIDALTDQQIDRAAKLAEVNNEIGLFGSTPERDQRKKALEQEYADEAAVLEDLKTRYVTILLPQENYNKGLEVQQKGLESAAQAMEKYNETRDRVTKEEMELTAKYNAETESIAAQRKLTADREDEDFRVKRLQAETENAKKLAIADEDYYATRAKKIRDFNQSGVLADTKANQKRLDDIEKYNADSLQAARDLQRKIGDIEAKTKNDIIDAAARLDARALDKALRMGKQQIDEAQKTYNEQQAKRKAALDKELADLIETVDAEKQERARAFAQQLADDEEQHRRQHDRAVQAFQDQLALEDQARKTRLRRVAEDAALEDQARLMSYRTQLTNLHNQLLKPMEDLQKSAWARVLMAAKQGYDQLSLQANLANQRFQEQLYATTRGAVGSKPIPVRYGGPQTPLSAERTSFDEGGVPPLGRAVQVGGQGPEMAVFTSPVKIYPSYASSRVGGGPTLNIGNIYLDGSPAGPGLDTQVRQVFGRIMGEFAHGSG